MRIIHIILFTACLIISSCGAEEEDTTPPPSVVATPEPEPPAPTQYTLTVTAGDGGTVSTEGGTYDEGTQVTVTALPDEGYGFLGWEGSNNDSSSLNLTINADTTIQALFAQLPALVLPSLPSKIFTKDIPDTLLFSFSSSAGYKSIDIQSELGSVEIIQKPEVGVENGDVILQYTPNSIGNVNHMVTIAGHDDINISITDQNDLETNEFYRIRTQPEPIFKNYLLPSHDLFHSRIRVDLNTIRHLNQKDNLYQDFCEGDETNYYNSSGNYFDGLSGVSFADFNGDGYDDILIHPQYTTYRFGGATSVKMEYELYIYQNGNYVFLPFNWGSKLPPKSNLGRKIITGDFDNDGDPDVFVATQGLDIPPFTPEFPLFIINNFSTSQSFDYKYVELLSGNHGASAADIDNDGDLDIFSVGVGSNTPQIVNKSKFLINHGNFNFGVWDDIIESENDPFWSWKSSYHNELVDVDKDGNIDLIVMGHEWDYMYDWCSNNGDGSCGRGKIYWGDQNGKFDENRKSLIPIVRNFGTSTDIDIIDIDNDNINEIIVSRTGGDIDSFPINSDDLNDNFSVSNGTSYYYGGHYIQICKIDDNREIMDVTNDLIEDNINSNQLSLCSPEDGWFIQTRLEDYNGNGSLNLFNSLVDYRLQHIWEWNGSRFVKISP